MVNPHITFRRSKGMKMKNETKKFIAYLNLLDVKIDSGSFASRIKAQKLAYIIQKLINETLYEDFNFYIRGPYSHSLAQEYFVYHNEFAEGDSNYKPTKNESEEIERVKPLLDSLSQTDLEIVASLLFLKKDKGINENDAELKLKELKQHLKIEDIWRGSNTIKRLFLTEKLRVAIMNSLEKEMEEWNGLSNEGLRKFE